MTNSETPDPTPHLSDEQFADCMIGPPYTPRIAAHLAACDLCQAEVARFQNAVNSFNAVSLAWSEARPPARASAPRPRMPSLASWALAACLAIAVSLAALVRHDSRVRLAQPLTAAATFQGDSPEQIARDNKLLLAVDQATAVDVPSPSELYGAAASSKLTSTPRRDRDSDD